MGTLTFSPRYLSQVRELLARERFDILVVGAGYSLLPGPNGAKNAYPARLQMALAELLPGVAVKVTTDAKARRTAAEMAKTLAPALAAAKPALMVWQTGTVDAMQSVGVLPVDVKKMNQRGGSDLM